jgi:hypothetical protein
MDFIEALYQIDERVSLDLRFDSCVQFMVAASRSLPLSDIALNSLAVAERYLAGSVSDQELQQTRVACWESIRGRENATDRDVVATRAVICTLFPRSGTDSFFDVLGAFADFAMGAGAISADLAALLLATFDAAQPAVAADGASPRR